MANKKNILGVRVYLTISAIAGVITGFIAWGGLRDLNKTLIWGGLAFIVVLVAIATLDLSMRGAEPQDPSEPRLK
jgi:cation transporter-like permease